MTVDPHEVIFSEGALKLGEIHWYILRADNLMDQLTYKRDIHRPGACVHMPSQTKPAHLGHSA